MNSVVAETAERTSSFSVEVGLYLIRYAPTSVIEPPVAFVRASPGSESDVKFIYAPDSASCLSGPGAVVVALVERRANVQFTVKAVRGGGSLDAKLDLERLDRLAEANSVRQSQERPVSQPQAMPPENPGIDFVGHVTRRGDVRVAPKGWLAGPSDPARIEGVSLRMNPSAHDLSVEYQAKVAGEQGWTRWMRDGEFAGSRGHSRAIVCVRLRLAGRSASRFLLSVSALFLGSAEIEKRGQDVELQSLAGVDPLIGLKIDIVADAPAKFGKSPIVGSSAETIQTSGSGKSRVRVFRAGAELTPA